MNTALSQNKPLVSVLFDKSTWNPEVHELGALLKSHGVCLDLSAGSGSALSHQYDQGQVNELISHCYGVLYGTGDIHPPEPPRTPEHETQVRSRALLTFFKASISNTVIRATFSFNLWRNGIVALQVERAFVARITTACSTCHATNFSVVSCRNMLHEVDPSSTFCNNFFSTCNTEICQQPIRFEIWQTFLS